MAGGPVPEHEQERRTTRAQRPRPQDRESDRPPGPVAAPGSAAEMAVLQRTVGNAAVARMLADRPVQRSAVHDVLGTTGRPLEQPVREDMEARFGTDFSDVRLHTDATAQRSAAEIGARAYTSGNHIVLGGAKTDEHTLAHELTHVVQQRSGPVAGTDDGTGLKVSDPSDRFERAAEANAHRVMAAPHPHATTEAGVQRSTGGAARDHAAVQRAPAAAGPAPALGAAVQSDESAEGVCGYFSRVREWEIANPQQGVIIQKVTRNFAVERHTGQGWSPIDGPGLDTYVKTGGTVNGSELQYWELWVVGADGTISDGGHDTFGMTSLIESDAQLHNTTRGSFTISGEAHFYATAQAPTAMGFQPSGAVSAGGLFSRTTDPQSELAALGMTPAGGPVRYTARASWDSSDRRTPAVAAKPRTTVYTPKSAWSQVQESTA
ncbi:eCIS core domain-containing protein [Streptomyces laculatispora]